jgi:hypothetical protein
MLEATDDAPGIKSSFQQSSAKIPHDHCNDRAVEMPLAHGKFDAVEERT